MIYLKTSACYIAINQLWFIVSFPNSSNKFCTDFYELHKFITTQSVEPCTNEEFKKSFKTNI